MPLSVPLAMRDGLSARRLMSLIRRAPGLPCPRNLGANASTALRFRVGWSPRRRWPAPGTTTVRTRSLFAASDRGATQRVPNERYRLRLGFRDGDDVLKSCCPSHRSRVVPLPWREPY